MATGTFGVSDAVTTQAYRTRVAEETARKNRLIASGAVAVDEGLSASIGETKGVINLINLPDPSDDGTFDRASSNTALTGTDNKISEQNAMNYVLRRAKKWSFAQLGLDVARTDPVALVMERESNFWAGIYQDTFIGILRGVVADNVANDSGDMIHATSGVANTTASASTKFNNDGFIAALATSGDNMDQPGTIIVHSKQYATMLSLDLIDFVQPSGFAGRLATYAGRNVVVDDRVPSGTNALPNGTSDVAEAGVYTAFILRPGALTLGFGVVGSGTTAVKEDAEAGNNFGSYKFITRRAYVAHPTGFTLTSAAITNQNEAGPLDTTGSGNFGNGASWDRLTGTKRKSIGITAYTTRET